MLKSAKKCVQLKKLEFSHLHLQRKMHEGNTNLESQRTTIEHNKETTIKHNKKAMTSTKGQRNT